jgi:hypothetical protein
MEKGKELMKTREQIISSMCMTFRHDWGLDKSEFAEDGAFDNFSCGMTQTEREFLWNQMAQIFDNDIAPHMKFIKPKMTKEERANRKELNRELGYGRIGFDTWKRNSNK